MLLLFTGDDQDSCINIDKKYIYEDYTIDQNLLNNEFDNTEWVERMIRYTPDWMIPINNLENSNLVRLYRSIIDVQQLRDDTTVESTEFGGFRFLLKQLQYIYKNILISSAYGEGLDKLAYDLVKINRRENEDDAHLRYRIYELLFDFIPQKDGYQRLIEKWLGNECQSQGYNIIVKNHFFGSQDYGFLGEMFCGTFDCKVHELATVHIIIENAKQLGVIYEEDLTGNAFCDDTETFCDSYNFIGVQIKNITRIEKGSIIDNLIKEINYTKAHGINVWFELHKKEINYNERYLNIKNIEEFDYDI